MKKTGIYLVSLCLSSCLLFTGCSATLDNNQNNNEVVVELEEINEDNNENQDEVENLSSENSIDEGKMTMKNIELSTVPSDYYQGAREQGTLQVFTYDTKDYIGNGNVVQRQATVYLPYGYDQNDTETQYNILYLQHGAYGNNRTWMYEYGDNFKNMIDHMIEDELIPPLIIVMPYLLSGNEWYHDTTPIFYSGEIRNDLMPAVESYYHTYASDTTDAGFESSRSHRAFGGFSAGGTTTWTVLLEGIERFEFFMPLSGGLTLGGNGSTSEVDASELANVVESSEYDKREYYIFAATGTRDVAYQGLSAQIEAMKNETSAFDFTETGFENGNLMYYTVEGNRHDYQYTYEYVFNGLQCLFSWYEAEN